MFSSSMELGGDRALGQDPALVEGKLHGHFDNDFGILDLVLDFLACEHRMMAAIFSSLLSIWDSMVYS